MIKGKVASSGQVAAAVAMVLSSRRRRVMAYQIPRSNIEHLWDSPWARWVCVAGLCGQSGYACESLVEHYA